MIFWLVLGWMIAIISLVLIGLSVWYIRKVFQQVDYLNQDVEQISKIVQNYYKYLNVIKNLDMYSGEPVVIELVEKTKIVSEQLKSFSDFFLEKGEIEDNSVATTEEEE